MWSLLKGKERFPVCERAVESRLQFHTEERAQKLQYVVYTHVIQSHICIWI